jgi:carboxymethylenebutenolidase
MRHRTSRPLVSRSLASLLVSALVLAACAQAGSTGASAPAPAPAVSATPVSTGIAAGAVVATAGLPAGAEEATARLASSPRHGEWVMIATGPSDSIRAWVVYPERSTKAPVVLVVHEIFGLTPWVRAVADQLAADGFVAVAPDLLTGRIDPTLPDSAAQVAARAAIRELRPEDVQRQLDAVARHAMTLPAAMPRYGVVGFCWGGSTVFQHAVHAPSLGASVVYYGSSPSPTALASVRAPVLGLYGENDARVNATVPAADSTMRALGRTYEVHTFAGAGHGFLRQQSGQSGANMAATRAAWPLTVAFFRRHLER